MTGGGVEKATETFETQLFEFPDPSVSLISTKLIPTFEQPKTVWLAVVLKIWQLLDVGAAEETFTKAIPVEFNVMLIGAQVIGMTDFCGKVRDSFS